MIRGHVKMLTVLLGGLRELIVQTIGIGVMISVFRDDRMLAACDQSGQG